MTIERMGGYVLVKGLTRRRYKETFLAIGSHDDFPDDRSIVLFKRLTMEGALCFEYRRRLEREIDIYQHLSQASFVRMIAHGTEAGRSYIVLEYVEGVTLRQLLTRLQASGTRLPEAAALCIMSRVLLAMSYLHGDGREIATRGPIIHADLHPDNILLTRDGDVKIFDFEAARKPGDPDCPIRMFTHFTAPEGLECRPVDHRVDIYAMGALLYCSLVTTPCFWKPSKTNRATILEHLRRGQVPVPSRVDPQLERYDSVVRRATSTQPRDRYSTAREMLADLESKYNFDKLRVHQRGLSDYFGAAFSPSCAVSVVPL